MDKKRASAAKRTVKRKAVTRASRRQLEAERASSPKPGTSASAVTPRDKSASLDTTNSQASPSRIPAPPSTMRRATNMTANPEVTEDIVNQSLAMLEWMQTDDLGELTVTLEDMQYQGFGPKKFLTCMWALGKAGGYSQAEYMKHIRSMACLGLIRGSKLKKLREGGNVNLQCAIADWTRVYKLTDGKPTGSNVVTLVRVAASLVMPLSRGLHQGIVGLPVSQASPIGQSYNSKKTIKNVYQIRKRQVGSKMAYT